MSRTFAVLACLDNMPIPVLLAWVGRRIRSRATKGLGGFPVPLGSAETGRERLRKPDYWVSLHSVVTVFADGQLCDLGPIPI